MNKKGMEISINVIVGLILGLLMLSAGLFIFNKIIQNSKETNLKVDEAIKQKLLESFDAGETIFIPETEKTVRIGKDAYVYYGIRNIYNENKYFKTEITSNNGLTISYNSEPKLIKSMDKEAFLFIASTKNLGKGTYSAIIRVKICQNEYTCIEDYTNPRIVRITAN